MNQSIYLMLGVPYAMLFVVGFMIYRGVRKNEVYIQQVGHVSNVPQSPEAR